MYCTIFGSGLQRHWSDCADAQVDLRLFVCIMTKHVLSWSGSIMDLESLSNSSLWHNADLQTTSNSPPNWRETNSWEYNVTRTYTCISYTQQLNCILILSIQLQNTNLTIVLKHSQSWFWFTLMFNEHVIGLMLYIRHGLKNTQQTVKRRIYICISEFTVMRPHKHYQI